MTQALDLKIYNQEGKEAGSLKLPEKVFGLSWNPNMMNQVILSLRMSGRENSAHKKGRGEVRGGGRKPWRQKGTGFARHGSIRSPIWRGGGVAHGPTNEKNYERKINKKMRRQALFMALSQKLRDYEILLLDKIEISEAKTKRGQEVLKSLSKIKNFEKLNSSGALILIPKKDELTLRSLRNLKNVKVKEARNLDVLEALSHKFILISQESLKVLENNFVK